MQRRMAYSLVALVLGLLLAGCEIPATNMVDRDAAGGAAEAPAPAPEVQAPALPTVRVTGSVVNVRAGPSLEHEVLAQMQQGDVLPAVGISADREWLQVERDGALLWIFANLTNLEADVRAALPVRIAEVPVEDTAGMGPTPIPALPSIPIPTVTAAAFEAEFQPAALTVTVTGAVANLRSGPALAHEILGQVREGEELPVTGISENRQWLHVTPAGVSRWIYADLTDVAAEGWAGLPVLAPFPGAGVAWVLADHAPRGDLQVCQRSTGIREAIRAALKGPGPTAPPCADITWANLATIRTLGVQQQEGDTTTTLRVPIGQAQDLAGLTGLEEAHLYFTGQVWPEHLFEGLPQLEVLTLEAPDLATVTYPDLSGLIRLHTLDLHTASRTSVVEDLWLNLPGLEALRLRRSRHRQISDGWGTITAPRIQGSAQLHTLVLENLCLAPIPADLLASTPQLHTLVLWESCVDAVPAQVLTPVSDLRILDLRLPNADTVPADLLAATPNLEHINLALNVREWNYDKELVPLPSALWSHLPHLQTLTLRTRDIQIRPDQLAAQKPQLTRLHLSSFLLGIGPRMAFPPLAELTLHAVSLGLVEEEPALPVGNTDSFTVRTLNLNKGRTPAILGIESHRETTLVLNLIAEDRDRLLNFGYGGDTPPTVDDRRRRLLLNVTTPVIYRLELLGPQVTTLNVVAPQLRELSVNAWLEQLQISAPALRELELRGLAPERLSALLTTLPWLRRLSLNYHEPVWKRASSVASDTPPLQELPDFLAAAPRVTVLEMGGSSWYSRVPPSFLTRMSQMTQLRLDLAFLEQLPPGFLTQVPQLTELELHAPALVQLSPDFLAQVPQLTRLHLDLPHLELLPPGFLTQVPQLTELELHAPALVQLSPDFLAQVPQLTRLHLDLPHLELLPPGFLTQVPQLTELELHAPALAQLSPDFLAQVPQLTRLHLDLPHLEQLPPGFLTQVPQLGWLRLDLAELEQMPPDFLAQAPRLADVYLDADLPAPWTFIFQAYAPQRIMEREETRDSPSQRPSSIIGAYGILFSRRMQRRRRTEQAYSLVGQ